MTQFLYHFLPNHREQCIGMIVSLQGVNFTSQQAEHIFEMLALMEMLFARLVITNLTVILTCGHSVILALFFDWEIYFTPEQTFLHQNLYGMENGVKI